MSVEAAIAAAVMRAGLDPVPIYRGRIGSARDAEGDIPLPVILFRQTGVTHPGTLEFGGPIARGFEVECRAATPEGAQRLAETVLAAFGSTGRPLDDYDDYADGSAQRLGYFAHTVELEVAA